MRHGAPLIVANNGSLDPAFKDKRMMRLALNWLRRCRSDVTIAMFLGK